MPYFLKKFSSPIGAVELVYDRDWVSHYQQILSNVE